MDFQVNPACFSAAFTIPAAIADCHLKLCKAEHIKVILYIFRNIADGIDISKISDKTDIDEYDVKEALLYWADAGILVSKETAPTAVKPTAKAVTKSRKPDRTDVAKRGLEDEKIQYLIKETSEKLGRFLKQNETNTLVWLYEDQGLDVSIILLVVQYAVSKDKANIRFIERTAVELIDGGVETMAEAEEFLHRRDMDDMAWRAVCGAFGLEKRKPSKKETEHVRQWIYDWKISKELLCAAYDECVNAKSKFSFPYVAKIIENWHKDGINSPNDIEKKPKPQEKEDFGAFDLDLYEKMINSRD